MSHELKKPNPDKSRVTVIQRGKRIRYAGPLEIVDKTGNVLVRLRFSRNGCKSVMTHHVRAWLETDYEVRT